MAVTTIAIETHDPSDLLDAVTSALRDAETTWLTEDGQRRAVIAPAAEGGQPATTELLAAARAAIPALVLLGDFIGNTFDGKAGIPAFDRCAVILALRKGLAKAGSVPGETGGLPSLADLPAEDAEEPAWPGEDVTSHNRAAAVLTGAGVAAVDAAAVVRRAYGHLSATSFLPGTSALAHVTYDRETGQYTVTMPPGRTCAGDTEFDVRCVTDVTAGDPLEAARKAHRIQREPSPPRGVFIVTELGYAGAQYRVDLDSPGAVEVLRTRDEARLIAGTGLDFATGPGSPDAALTRIRALRDALAQARDAHDGPTGDAEGQALVNLIEAASAFTGEED